MKPLDWILIALVVAAVIAAIIVWRKSGSCSCSSGGCCGDCSKCGTANSCTKEMNSATRTAAAQKEEEPVTVAFEVDEDLPPIDPEQSRTTQEYIEFQQQIMEDTTQSEE